VQKSRSKLSRDQPRFTDQVDRPYQLISGFRSPKGCASSYLCRRGIALSTHGSDRSPRMHIDDRPSYGKPAQNNQVVVPIWFPHQFAVSSYAKVTIVDGLRIMQRCCIAMRIVRFQSIRTPKKHPVCQKTKFVAAILSAF